MKRIICILFILIFSTSVFAAEISTISRDEEITVYFEDTLLTFDTAPVISDGRIIAPVREISETLGADVAWDGDSKTAIISSGQCSVSFTIGEKTMLINGDETEIDVAAAIIKDRTFVPLRALAESLQLNVHWDEETKTAFLTLKKPLGKDYLISPTYYVASEEFEGCVIACKTMVLSNYFDEAFTFAEILELNGGGVYANWGPEYCMDLFWNVIFESELALKQETENWAESAFTPAEKLEIIASSLEGSSGIIAQFAKDHKTHGVVITGYTAEGELIVCDPDTNSDRPENTPIADSCLADMLDVYTTEEILPYLTSMRLLEK